MATRGRSEAKQVSPDLIDRNPDNPRLVFRTAEIETLLLSIKRYGILVPLTVYRKGRRYVLIDGERRWRCALKLNLEEVPVLVQDQPSDLDNLLLMFNIHALREQWDYFTIANKLPKVIDLYAAKEGQPPNEAQLSEITGLTRGQIRRCRLLLDLPERYKKLLLRELELPKHKQKLSEDLFIEMERALKTVATRLPDVLPNVNAARDVLIEKYRIGVIHNVVDFRMLSKMATAIQGLGIDESTARRALKRVLGAANDVGIEEEFKQHFEIHYGERRVELQIETLLEFLDDLDLDEDDDAHTASIIKKLRKLRDAIDKVIGD
jgi:ParB family transcriptional regulator, chromosome partitioning protein